MLGQRANSIIDTLQQIASGGQTGIQPQQSPTLTNVGLQPTYSSQLEGMAGIRPYQVPADVGVIAANPNNKPALESMPDMREQGMSDQSMGAALNRMRMLDGVNAMGEARSKMPPEVEEKAVVADAVVRKAAADPEAAAADPTFGEKVKGFFGNEENMLRLAMAFNTMRMDPDPNIATFATRRLETLQASKAQQAKIDQMAQGLIEMGMDAGEVKVLSQNPDVLKAIFTEQIKAQKGLDSPADQRAFEALIANMSPEDQERARRIKVGLEAREALGSEYWLEKAVATALGGAAGKAEVEGEIARQQGATTYAGLEQALDNYQTVLTDANTFFGMGFLPAVTDKQQIAEQYRASLGPLLKSAVRDSGEGVFTDADQALLMAMLPSRNTNESAIPAQIAFVKQVIKAKMDKPDLNLVGYIKGINGNQQQQQQQQTPPPSESGIVIKSVKPAK